LLPAGFAGRRNDGAEKRHREARSAVAIQITALAKLIQKCMSGASGNT
jgi:hypothetical protein